MTPLVNILDTDINVSPVGFGTLRLDGVDTFQKEALEKALLSGINCIETGRHYMDGASENCVGDVVNSLVKNEKIKRNDLVIMSKCGFIQGHILDESNSRKEEGIAYIDELEMAPDLNFCMHPAFIAEQIQNSLTATQLKYIDIYLIHNPEMYFIWCEKHKISLEEARENFYERLKWAFEAFEKAVEQGLIKYYGLCSNVFNADEDEMTYISLDKCVDIAKSITDNHHFKVLEVPINIIEGEQENVLELAKKHHLSVFSTRPINTIKDNKIHRLSDFDFEEDIDENDLQTLLDQLIQYEKTWPEFRAESLGFEEQELTHFQTNFMVGMQLFYHWDKLDGIEHWQNVMQNQIYPRIHVSTQTLQDKDLDNAQQTWLEGYLNVLNEFTRSMTEYYKSMSYQNIKDLKQKLKKEYKDTALNSLSQLAVYPLVKNDLITCTLVGMRQPTYVKEMLRVIDAI